MAHARGSSKNNNINNKANASNISPGGDGEVKPSTFHDFLGKKGAQAQESAATSDLGSERHTGNHLEGIPFYGSRGDITGPESSNRFMGYKRSNSDSFMVSSRDKFPQGQADSQDSPLLTKLLRYSGGERPRRPHEEETSFGMHHLRPLSASLMSQTTAGGRTDATNSKWDRAMPVSLGPGLQYPPRSGQVMPFGYQAPSNRFKETNVGPSVISQTAADEGSRTGIKGSGILSSINAAPGTISGRQPSGVLIHSGKQKSGVSIPEPESSTNPSQRASESGGHQMTIFYGGQAHVFDNVHPNKAEVIMVLAGSNGGSWSTTYKPNSAVRPSNAGENRDTDVGSAILRELQARPSDKGDTARAPGPGD